MGGIGGVGTPEGTAPGIGIGGPGGFGGYSIDEDGFVTLSNPNPDSASINAALSEAFGEVDAASADIGLVGRGAAGNILSGAAAVLTMVFTGSLGAAEGVHNLTNRGIDKAVAMRAVSKAEHHAAMLKGAGEHNASIEPMESFTRGLAADLIGKSGGPEKIKQRAAKVKYEQETKKSGVSASAVGTNGKPSGDFWSQFVSEWQGAKDDILKNDQFKKDKLAPVFDTYQNRLAGLSNEPTFKPITVGMGDFKTSFQTRRSMTAADKILGSELAETEVMLPKAAQLQYLDRLEALGKWKKELNKSKSSNRQQYPDDQGTWLDAVGDIMKIGSSAADIYSKLG